jgi:hypothetical protein
MKHGPEITKERQKPAEDIRPFSNVIQASKDLPHGMAAKQIIFSSRLNESLAQTRMLCAPYLSMVTVLLLSKCSGLPSLSLRTENRDYINAAKL